MKRAEAAKAASALFVVQPARSLHLRRRRVRRARRRLHPNRRQLIATNLWPALLCKPSLPTRRADRCALMLVLIATFAVASAERADAQHPLTLLPLDDPAYVQLDVLERLGCSEARVSAFRPFMVRDVRIAVRVAANDPECPALLVDALQRRFLQDTAKIMAVKATEIASRELVREFPTLSSDSSRPPTSDSARL